MRPLTRDKRIKILNENLDIDDNDKNDDVNNDSRRDKHDSRKKKRDDDSGIDISRDFN